MLEWAHILKVNIYSLFVFLIIFFLWILHFFSSISEETKRTQFSLKRSSIFTPFGIMAFILAGLSWFVISNSLVADGKIKKEYITILDNDVFLVIDTSRSMLANDYTPNRFMHTKNMINNFIDLNPIHRMGLMAFSEDIYTSVPLTMDHNLISEALESIFVGDLGNGTNIGDVLLLAVYQLKYSQSKNKSIVLLTDGVGQIEKVSPVDVIPYAIKNKVKIHSIGIGNNKDARIPSVENNKIVYRKLPGGSIDFKSLKEISDKTGGEFYKVDEKNSLNDIFKTLANYERNKSGREVLKSNNEGSNILLFYALLVLLFLELCNFTLIRRMA